MSDEGGEATAESVESLVSAVASAWEADVDDVTGQHLLLAVADQPEVCDVSDLIRLAEHPGLDPQLRGRLRTHRHERVRGAAWQSGHVDPAALAVAVEAEVDPYNTANMVSLPAADEEWLAGLTWTPTLVARMLAGRVSGPPLRAVLVAAARLQPDLEGWAPTGLPDQLRDPDVALWATTSKSLPLTWRLQAARAGWDGNDLDRAEAACTAFLRDVARAGDTTVLPVDGQLGWTYLSRSASLLAELGACYEALGVLDDRYAPAAAELRDLTGGSADVRRFDRAVEAEEEIRISLMMSLWDALDPADRTPERTARLLVFLHYEDQRGTHLPQVAAVGRVVEQGLDADVVDLVVAELVAEDSRGWLPTRWMVDYPKAFTRVARASDPDALVGLLRDPAVPDDLIGALVDDVTAHRPEWPVEVAAVVLAVAATRALVDADRVLDVVPVFALPLLEVVGGVAVDAFRDALFSCAEGTGDVDLFATLLVKSATAGLPVAETLALVTQISHDR